MNKKFPEIRKERERNSVIVGVLLTLALHAGGLTLISYTGLKYIWPPPQESSFLVDFDEEYTIRENALEARGEDADPDEHTEIVQRSESPVESTTQNLTTEAKDDGFGDVEAPAPEPKLDPRAAFPGMAKKDTTLTAAHSATESTDSFKAGQARGNTDMGATDGRPNAHLEGRVVKAGLKKPSYTSQESGIVVVTIWVDNYGEVKKAVAGGDGTTVTDKTLWAAARAAAMETHFNQSADAPAMQQGTITYIFNLK